MESHRKLDSPPPPVNPVSSNWPSVASRIASCNKQRTEALESRVVNKGHDSSVNSQITDTQRSPRSWNPPRHDNYVFVELSSRFPAQIIKSSRDKRTFPGQKPRLERPDDPVVAVTSNKEVPPPVGVQVEKIPPPVVEVYTANTSQSLAQDTPQTPRSSAPGPPTVEVCDTITPELSRQDRTPDSYMGAHQSEFPVETQKDPPGRTTHELIALYQAPSAEDGARGKQFESHRNPTGVIPKWGRKTMSHDEPWKESSHEHANLTDQQSRNTWMEEQLILTKPAFKVTSTICSTASLVVPYPKLEENLQQCDVVFKSLPPLPINEGTDFGMKSYDLAGRPPKQDLEDFGIPLLNLPLSPMSTELEMGGGWLPQHSSLRDSPRTPLKRAEAPWWSDERTLRDTGRASLLREDEALDDQAQVVTSMRDNTKRLAEEYVQRLLKVKLPESSTSRKEGGVATLKKREFHQPSQVNKTRRTKEESSANGVKVFQPSSASDGYPRELLTVIDHLTELNQQLRAELARVEKDTKHTKQCQLEELEKMQRCVVKLKQSSKNKAVRNKSTQTSKGKPLVEVRSVKSQTEECVALQSAFPPIVIQLPRYRKTVQVSGSSGSSDTLSSDSAGLEGEVQVAESRSKEAESKSEGAEAVIGVTNYRGSLQLESRATQTELETGYHGAMEELEVPPQWLLSEALARSDNIQKFAKDCPKKQSSDDNIEKISTATQVDLSNLRKKDRAIKLQGKTISALKSKIDVLKKDMDSLEDSSRRRILRERRYHRGMQSTLEQQITQVFNVLQETRGVLPPEVQELVAAVAEDFRDAKSSDEDSISTPKTVTAALENANVGDVTALKDYVKALSKRLEKMHVSYNQAKQRLCEQEKDIQVKEYTQNFLESCVQKMKTEVEQLSHKLFTSKTDVDQTSFKEKGGKHSENVKTQLLQGRLRDANQQIIVKSRQNQELKHHLEEADNTAQNLRGRIARAEAANQNKNILIENYKKQIQNLENKVVSNVRHRDSILSEVRTLKEATNGMRKQIAELGSELSERDAQSQEWSRTQRRLNSRVSELLGLLEQKEAQLKSVEDDATSRMQQALQVYQLYIADVEERVRGAERRTGEFAGALQCFLQALEQRTQQTAQHSPSQSQVVCATVPEAQNIACSILNLTPEQLLKLMTPGYDVTPQDLESSQSIREFWKIVKNEDFSEKLSQFLVKIVMENKVDSN